MSFIQWAFRLSLFCLLSSFSQIQTLTVAQETENMNRNFALWKDLEGTLTNDAEKGKLYANLADAYSEMGLLSWALLYDEKSLLHRPRDASRYSHLQEIQKALNLNPTSPTPSFFEKFKRNIFLSEDEALQLLNLSLGVGFLSASLYLFTEKKGWQCISLLSFILCLVFMSSAFYLRFLTPIEGVLIHASFIYRGAGEQYSKIMEIPLPAGEKVKVVSYADQGHWWKITTSHGAVGFVPQETIRVI